MNAHFIDDVARRMTDVEPPIDVRSRVVARLAPRRSPWRVWQPLTAAAAIAVVSAAVVVRTPVPLEIPMPPASPIARVDASTMPAGDVPAVTVTQRKPAPKNNDFAAADAIWRARAIPAIAAEPPLVAGDIQPEFLSVPLLELKPLVTTPVIVAPIVAADASGGR